MADGFEQPDVVEPRHPFQGRQFECLPRLPWRAPVNQLRLVQPVDRLRQRVVVTVSLAAHGRLDARLGQALAVADADVL